MSVYGITELESYRGQEGTRASHELSVPTSFRGPGILIVWDAEEPSAATF